MNKTLEQLRAELRDMRRQAEQLTMGLTKEELGRRPQAGQWSISECLLHLNLVAADFQPRIGKAIQMGKDKKFSGTGAFRLGFFGVLLRSIAEPPPKFKLPAPKNITPPPQHDPEQAAADFISVQDRWEQLMREAEGLDMARVRMPFVPALPGLRLSAAFAWMFAHQRRHLWQAENVKRRIEARHS